ncbi:hypothetical protein LZB41_09235, partial [Campylobacter jejuni]|nr:hypothetical protein [Campylobacter jejuni]
PCKLGRRIHAAHAPAQPTRPASDSFRWRSATEKKKEEQRQEQKPLGWPLFVEPSPRSASFSSDIE